MFSSSEIEIEATDDTEDVEEGNDLLDEEWEGVGEEEWASKDSVVGFATKAFASTAASNLQVLNVFAPLCLDIILNSFVLFCSFCFSSLSFCSCIICSCLIFSFLYLNCRSTDKA